MIKYYDIEIINTIAYPKGFEVWFLVRGKYVSVGRVNGVYYTNGVEVPKSRLHIEAEKEETKWKMEVK